MSNGEQKKMNLSTCLILNDYTIVATSDTETGLTIEVYDEDNHLTDMVTKEWREDNANLG